MDGEVENESYIELGALNIQAAVHEGVQSFYLFGVPVGERPSV